MSDKNSVATDVFGNDEVGRRQSFIHKKFGPIFGINIFPIANFVGDSHNRQNLWQPGASYYRNTVLPQEGVDINKVYKQLDKLYRENHPDVACHFDNIMVADEPKIPFITHSIWLTNLDKPVELTDDFLRWYKQSCKVHLASVGWKHYLWVQDKKKLPKTVREMERAGVEIKEVYSELSDEKDFYGLKPCIDQEIAQAKFGRASDILRCVLLYRLGGIYRDVDFEMTRPFTGLALAYDFFSGIEYPYSCPCNALMASRPTHPIIGKMLELITRNLDPKTAPPYIEQSLKVGGEELKTLCSTGPITLGVAVKKVILDQGTIAFGLPIIDQPDGHRDRNIVFPPEVFFGDVREKSVGKGPSAFGWHAFKGSWLKKEFGSNG
ncbi:glycosyltransferase family 32 protein [Candidatus Finniella inopinata]|nr:glycosyltransferase [Candidatus Finniella inopinata]